MENYTTDTPSTRELIRIAELRKMIGGLSDATIWRKMKSGTFPLAVKVNSKCRAWFRDEVEAWLESLPRVQQD